jgi:hypothetical protein
VPLATCCMAGNWNPTDPLRKVAPAHLGQGFRSDLQTAPTWSPDLDRRGLDGLEGPVMSGATGQIAVGSSGQMPEAIHQFRVSTHC